MVITGTAGGPNWTDIMTAFGTVGAVIVALGIALWTERRSDRRVREERAHSDRVLAEQREHERAAIEDERAHGAAQLEEERKIVREREQLAQAYAVQVVLAQHPGKVTGANEHGVPTPSGTRRLVAVVVNHGSYAITGVEVQFCLGDSMISHRRYERVPNLDSVAKAVGPFDRPPAEGPLRGVLTPFDEGIRFETDEMDERHLVGPYAVARWTDQWGTRWEHKRGVVGRIRDEEQWAP